MKTTERKARASAGCEAPRVRLRTGGRASSVDVRVLAAGGWLAVLLLPLLAAGCLLAAGGAAAGGGVYFTSRGAESIVQGNVDQVAGTTRSAFSTLGVRHTGQKEMDDGEGLEVFGETDDGDVTVTLERRTANATKVEVKVRKSAVTWDKDMAREILEEIRKLRGGD